jgi:hypothetical protein
LRDTRARTRVLLYLLLEIKESKESDERYFFVQRTSLLANYSGRQVDRKYSRYVNGILRTQESTTLPKTIEGCDDGARYNTVKDLRTINGYNKWICSRAQASALITASSSLMERILFARSRKTLRLVRSLRQNYPTSNVQRSLVFSLDISLAIPARMQPSEQARLCGCIATGAALLHHSVVVQGSKRGSSHRSTITTFARSASSRSDSSQARDEIIGKKGHQKGRVPSIRVDFA